MKHLYLLLAIIGLMMSSQARAYTVNFDFDEPSRIEFKINNQEIEIQSGLNTFEMARYSKFEIKARRGSALISVVDKNGTPFRIIEGLCSELVYPDADGNTYKVTTVDLDDARTAKCFVTVIGNPDLISASLPGTASRIFFTEGRQALFYSPEYEPQLTLSSLGDSPLYKVTVNGKELNTGWGCTIDLEPESEIIINQSLPQEDVTITFSFTPTAEGCVDVVNINKSDVRLDESNTVTCRPGDEMVVYLKDTYTLLGVKINGNELTTGLFESYFFLSVKENALIEIDARPYGDIPFKVTIDDPEAVNLYRGYINPLYRISLTEGENNVGVPETDPRLIVVLNRGFYFDSFTDASGTDYTDADVITITEGMELNISTSPIDVNSKAVLYVDDITLASYFFELLDSYDEERPAATGYNIIEFGEQHNPFELAWYADEKIGNAYINNTPMMPESPNTTTFPVTLADGDVMKVYLAGEPSLYEVELYAEENLKPEIRVDMIKRITDFPTALECFNGTRIDIEAPDCIVKVNDKDFDGTFLTVEGDTRINIFSEGSSSVMTDADKGRADVYDVLGNRVLVNATEADMKKLPAGIYIRDGKKTVRRNAR